MSTPRRRSSRLRTPQKGSNDVSFTPALPSLTEGAETAAAPIITVDSVDLDDVESQSTNVQTPKNNGRLRPESKEMHPAHFQSTAKKAASAKRLGLIAEEDAFNGQAHHQTAEHETAPELQSKSGLRDRAVFSSPTFDFWYARPSMDMSIEAQRMMDEVREQAARIKGEFDSQPEKHTQEDSGSELPRGASGRTIAKPRGKARRFSDVHLQEFKKMDSIAEYPSKFRSEGNLFAMAPTSLKRTNSKACLDQPETTPKRAGSIRTVTHEDREEGGPTKRVKKIHEPADPSNSKPNTSIRRDAPRTPTSATKRTASQIPTPAVYTRLVDTPTKASLARSASVKSLKTTSMIPSPVRSTATSRKLFTPIINRTAVPKTEGNHKYHKSIAQTLSNVKSILRLPQVLFSDDPLKIAAGTHISTPKKEPGPSTLTYPRPLPALPQDSPESRTQRIQKRVNFSISPRGTAQPARQNTPGTPSPHKMPGSFSPPVTYPSLATIFDQDDNNSPQHPATSTPTRTPARRATAAPRDFTFRADRTISFAQPPRTPERPRATEQAAFIRGPTDARSLADLPAVPHGLSNKKRKRDSDAVLLLGEDKENEVVAAGVIEGSPAKRARTGGAPAGPGVGAGQIAPAGRLPKLKKKPVLSMSRLNALAMPKERR